MYSRDFRTAAVHVYEYLGSMRKTALALKISVASICRWSRSIDTQSKTRRGLSKVTSAIEAVIRTELQQWPETTCPEIARRVEEIFGIEISRQSIHVVVERLGFTRKRTRKRGTSFNSVVARPPFCFALDSLRRGSDSTVIAIDESGFDQRCQPIYGYAPRGHPAIVKIRPCSDRRRFSLLMAIGENGSCTWSLSANCVNGATFSEFIRNLPQSPGTTIILDNASIHKTLAVREAALSKGYTLLFTPPYAPEFNPIELVFGIIKNDFYKRRYSESFNNDLQGSVVRSVTDMALPSSIRGCFRHVRGLVTSEIATLNQLTHI